MLTEAAWSGYRIRHAARMAEAVQELRSTAVDVVVLDLRLPDCSGLETIRRIRSVTEQIPIVVLTGSDDEALAQSCIDAGAQDYLAKSETNSRNFRRAVGYAITRVREAQLADLRATLERYRSLSSSAQSTTVTAGLAGAGPISVRQPAIFARIVREYLALLEPYLARATTRVVAPREAQERITTLIGDAGGGPRDFLDVHVAALDQAVSRKDDALARSLVFEARLLALEMMGLLVDYYRVGQRRRFDEGAR
jgi:CheY-like chemotaxis protein